MKLIIIGSPGSGKGTQSKIISKKLKIEHVAVGNIFRKLKKNNYYYKKINEFINKGKLLPDEITNKILFENLESIKNKKGYILDGFPRTVFQAISLDNFLFLKKEFINLVIILNIDNKVILKRILNRYSCLNCGASFNTIYNPMKKNNKCNFCGNDLIKREDDSKKIIIDRIKTYKLEMKKIIKYYYDKKKIIHEIKEDKSIEKTKMEILNFLERNI